MTEGTIEEDIAKRASTARSEQDEQIYSRAMIEVRDCQRKGDRIDEAVEPALRVCRE